MTAEISSLLGRTVDWDFAAEYLGVVPGTLRHQVSKRKVDNIELSEEVRSCLFDSIPQIEKLTSVSEKIWYQLHRKGQLPGSVRIDRNLCVECGILLEAIRKGEVRGLS